MISQILFSLALLLTLGMVFRRGRQIWESLQLGRPESRNDRPDARFKQMLLVAFGQKKMFKRPIPALLHLVVYVGFVIINIELLEIIIDGVIGSHRVFAGLGMAYNILIASFEWLALGVLLACVVFLIRRNILQLRRFKGKEMTSWPRSDANIILCAEIALMTAFLLMNAADAKLQQLGAPGYTLGGSFPVSSLLIPYLPDQVSTLIALERFCWWFHILGIFGFLWYLPYSKHLHILLAFPNTYFASLQPKGKLDQMESVQQEVKAMLDPSFVPSNQEPPSRFGAKDIHDLTWKNLLDAYTCTECGRCTSVCPANITGKALSPRKIMMDTRDRTEEVMQEKAKGITSEKQLLDDYIQREEIWACTTCNACVEACPVSINPLDIIVQLRRYAVMEESQAPAPIMGMINNVENNGAPWKYAQADRAAWRAHYLSSNSQ